MAHFTEPVWDYVQNALEWQDTPTDLSEMDGQWVQDWLAARLEMADQELLDELEPVMQRMIPRDWAGLAWDLRDVLHTERCEAQEWARYGHKEFL